MAEKIVVWTHAGQFHADEVSAVALLELYLPNVLGWVREFENPIINPDSFYWNFVDNSINAEFKGGDMDREKEENITLLAVDVGREFDGVTKFDHHHDPKLEAACVLIGEWLVSLGHLRKEIWDMMYRGMFQYMSEVDRGIIPGGGDSHAINALIRNLNCPEKENDAFLDAVELVKTLIKGAHRNISQALAEDKNWDGFKKHQGVVEMGDKKCRRWKMFASKEDIKYAVCIDERDSSRGTLMTRDSKQWPISTHNKQTFLHNSKFLAVYESYQDALDHAFELSKESELV